MKCQKVWIFQLGIRVSGEQLIVKPEDYCTAMLNVRMEMEWNRCQKMAIYSRLAFNLWGECDK